FGGKGKGRNVVYHVAARGHVSRNIGHKVYAQPFVNVVVNKKVKAGGQPHGKGAFAIAFYLKAGTHRIVQTLQPVGESSVLYAPVFNIGNKVAAVFALFKVNGPKVD